MAQPMVSLMHVDVPEFIGSDLYVTVTDYVARILYRFGFPPHRHQTHTVLLRFGKILAHKMVEFRMNISFDALQSLIRTKALTTRAELNSACLFSGEFLSHEAVVEQIYPIKENSPRQERFLEMLKKPNSVVATVPKGSVVAPCPIDRKSVV